MKPVIFVNKKRKWARITDLKENLRVYIVDTPAVEHSTKDLSIFFGKDKTIIARMSKELVAEGKIDCIDYGKNIRKGGVHKPTRIFYTAKKLPRSSGS